MKHHDFRGVTVDAAFGALEDSVLPALSYLIEAATLAQPGVNAATIADDLRTLTRDLEMLQTLMAAPAR